MRRQTQDNEPNGKRPSQNQTSFSPANSTKPETLIWTVLRSRKLEGLKFRRQHSIEPYIADFVCLDLKLIVEIDGEHHDDIYPADQRRQAYLESKGYRVIRFNNVDVLEDVEGVAIAIRKVCFGIECVVKTLTLTLSQRERGQKMRKTQ